MNEHQTSIPTAPRAGFSVRELDLVVLVAIGDQVLEVQLAPHAALELAAALLNAGLAHASARAEQRRQAEAVIERARTGPALN